MVNSWMFHGGPAQNVRGGMRVARDTTTTVASSPMSINHHQSLLENYVQVKGATSLCQLTKSSPKLESCGQHFVQVS